jgi:hypothetical protein
MDKRVLVGYRLLSFCLLKLGCRIYSRLSYGDPDYKKIVDYDQAFQEIFVQQTKKDDICSANGHKSFCNYDEPLNYRSASLDIVLWISVSDVCYHEKIPFHIQDDLVHLHLET